MRVIVAISTRMATGGGGIDAFKTLGEVRRWLAPRGSDSVPSAKGKPLLNPLRDDASFYCRSAATRVCTTADARKNIAAAKSTLTPQHSDHAGRLAATCGLPQYIARRSPAKP